MPEGSRIISRSRLAHLCTVILVALCVVLGAAPAAAQPEATQTSAGTADLPSFLRLSVDSISPSLVTSSGGSTVTVTGHVDNIGDRELHDLTIRLERGDPIADADGLRSGLAVNPTPVSVATPFRPLTDSLTAGATARFSVTVPLSGDGGLGIAHTGVYPLQVNVNGLPDYGNLAKLGESRTLLPVLSLPPDPARAAGYVDPSTGGQNSDADLGPDGSISPDLSHPAQFTMIWPLAAPPQLTPGVLGGHTEPVRLTGEQLAQSLSPGGRLRTLLDAARSIGGLPDDPDTAGASSGAPSGNSTESDPVSSGADPAGDNAAPSTSLPVGSTEQPAPPARSASKLEQSTCLGVDPDLLVTVRAMSLGYVVSNDPMNPTSSTTPGTGQSAAADWLTGLRELAAQMCVVALPFAQADLTSLRRIDNSGLITSALTAPADVVDAILGVHSVRGLTIPALGALDDTGAQVLRSASIGAAVTSASSVAPARNTADGRYRVGDLHVQTVDAPVTAALDGLGDAPATPVLTPSDQQVSFSGESAVARRQAAVGALAFTAIRTPAATTGGDTPSAQPVTGRSDFVMPPTYWAPTADDASALISTATVLLESGAANATPLSDVITRLGQTTSAARLTAPPGVESLSAAGMAVDSATAAAMRAQVEQSWQLQASLIGAEDVAATPERYMAPLREDILRAIRSPAQATARARDQETSQRSARNSAVASTLQRMLNSVTILDPGGRYTLASERSPLLLVVRNDLSLPIRVRMNVSAPKELEIDDIGVIEIPARGTRQIQLPTRADTSEAMTVTMSLTTSSGLSMGTPIRLSVHSNAYGKPLFWITVVAAAALVALTARRLWHRFRGEPDPADEDRPEPDEHERQLAGTTYQQRRRNLAHEEDHEDGSRSTGADR